jgi:hypothetical protein
MGAATEAVHIFRQRDDSWKLEASVKASNAGAGDRFGQSVALWGDTLAIGADVGDSPFLDGVVHVFVRTGTAWSQQARLIGHKYPKPKRRVPLIYTPIPGEGALARSRLRRYFAPFVSRCENTRKIFPIGS